MSIFTSTSLPSWLDITLRSFGVFLLYGLVIWISSLFTYEPSSTPLFWPANAIALGIMLYSKKERAAIYLAAALLSYYLYLVFHDSFGLFPSLLLTSANVIEISAGYILLRCCISQPLHFNRMKGAIEIIVYGVILNSTIGATAGTLIMASIWESTAFISWMIWFVTAAIGNLMVLPIVISWLSPKIRSYSLRDYIEMSILFTVLLVGSILIFGADKDKLFVYPYIAFPALLWSGMRFDLRVTSIAFLIFLFASAICSTKGFGPFAMGEFYREILLVRFNLFCGVTIITVLLVSALGSERKALIAELRAAMSQIKTLSGYIPICSHCKKIRDDSGFWNSLEAYLDEHSDAQLSHGICPSCAKEHYGKYLSGFEE